MTKKRTACLFLTCKSRQYLLKQFSQCHANQKCTLLCVVIFLYESWQSPVFSLFSLSRSALENVTYHHQDNVSLKLTPQPTSKSPSTLVFFPVLSKKLFPLEYQTTKRLLKQKQKCRYNIHITMAFNGCGFSLLTAC